MSENTPGMTLNDAAGKFLRGLPPDIARASAPEVRHFVSWFRGEKLIESLTPLDVAGYSERFSASDTDHARKLEILRKFLTCAKKEGWTESNLSVHLKARKDKTLPAARTPQTQTDMGVVTQQGYDDIQKELILLRSQRPTVLEDIRRAAADKDFRENAPLHAAREQLGHIDGRIKELEAIVKTATIIDQSDKSRSRVAVGNTVVLVAMNTGKTQTYKIVGPKESDPSKGKISHVSPIGKAIIGKKQGETVEVVVPSGKIHYRIDKVEN
ncbi:MAG: transcription elongation factor GreA [Dehalococcoidia bacterium]|nr:MAG: transcription elongation factor GreA [Dehalococcoidia bacterium]